MKSLAIISLALAASLVVYNLNSEIDPQIEEQFQQFLGKYGQNYGNTQEYEYRLSVFADNLEKIEQLNLEHKEATFGINQFADLTEQEFSSRLGSKSLYGQEEPSVTHVPALQSQNIDHSIFLNVHRTQGNCQSDWAFAGVDVFAARHQIRLASPNSIEVLSAQQLVDWDTTSRGCYGGFIQNVFYYLQDNNINSEAKYPYIAQPGGCFPDPDNIVGLKRPTRVDQIIPGNEGHLISVLSEGPIGVRVDATQWQFYISGVVSGHPTTLNYSAILFAAHYGTPNGDYLSLRTSFGPGWGEAGNIRITANLNSFGVSNDAWYPVL